jgi:hypothetical protein
MYVIITCCLFKNKNVDIKCSAHDVFLEKTLIRYVSGIAFIRYVSGIAFIRYVSGITFIRYALNRKIGKPNNLKFVIFICKLLM